MRKFVIVLVIICIYALTYNQYYLNEDKTSEETVTEETETEDSTTTSEETYPISLQTTDDYTMIASSPYMVL